MITEDAFPVEPWQVRETKLNLNLLAQSESLFALSNGHIGLRGNLDEGEPFGLPGTYLNSFYEIRPLPYAEAGYGYPEAGQTVVDVTNGKIFRLLVGDEPFDVRYGELISHERILDLRAGTLTRRAHWRSPAGKQVKVTSTRLVSLAHRSVAAIEYVVEAIEEFVRVTVQSELVTNEDVPETSADPRVSAILDRPLQAVEHERTERGALLMHRTRASALMMAAGMEHEVEVPGRVEITTDARPDLARTTVICGLRPGQKLRIVKYLAYGWSSLRSRPALRDQAAGALHGARYSGWQGLLDAQRAYLDDFWDSADVEVEGDVTTEEMAAWRDAADAANIPYDEELGVHQQCEGFTTLAEWDFEANTTYPLLLHEAYVRLYPAQVIKQADLVLAMQWQSHAFTPEQKARNVDYYERRMVRDSSLSACTQAVMCAEVGHLELAHDYAYEAALIDLRDLHRNTRDGLHMASLAGAWTALVVGFGGLRDDEGILSIDPQLPDGISRLRFRLRWRGFRLIVDANHTDVTFILGDGPGTQLTMRHAGQDLTLHTDTPSTIAVRTRKPLLPPPPQPPGREPVHRRALAR